MSEVYYSCKIFSGCLEAREILEGNLNAKFHCNFSDLDKGGFELFSQFGAEVDFGVFEKVASILDDTTGVEYKARLFDSSSGGVQLWSNLEDDIDLNEKRIIFLGFDDEELDEMKDLVEDDAQVFSVLDKGIDVAVLGSAVSESEMGFLSENSIECISEQEFWEYISDASI